MANNRLWLVCAECVKEGAEREFSHFLMGKTMGDGYYSWHESIGAVDKFYDNHASCSMGNDYCNTQNNFILEYEGGKQVCEIPNSTDQTTAAR